MRNLILLAVAILALGLAYLVVNDNDLRSGEIARQNPAILEEAATKGDVGTKLMAAGALIASKNLPDLHRGIAILEELAAHEEPQALQRLGMLYVGRFPGVPADPPRALSYLIRAAKAGSKPACGTVVAMYSNGIYGIPKDPVKAKEWQSRLDKM